METQSSAPSVGADREQRWALVQRIAASPQFHRSARLREFLIYVAGKTLSGGAQDLTEVRIAGEVFQRPDYNPVEDNLVRASARQLRLKLKEYFETEGRDEPWSIEIPKGSYAAVFRHRKETEVSVLRPAPQSRYAWYIAAVVSIVAILLGARYFVDDPGPRTLFNMLTANPHRRTEIVVIDSALVLAQALTGTNVKIEEYADRRYTSPPASGALQGPFGALLNSRQITSFADVEIVASIVKAYPARLLRIRHSRNMTARDFNGDDNFILIGSPLANPWAGLFEPALNFQFENHTGSWPSIRNRNPLPGEQAIYGQTDSLDETGPQFARIAVLRNESGRGRVVLIAGNSMEGTEAAGESFLNQSFSAEVVKLFNARTIEDLPDLELLLQTRGIGGTGRGAKIVSHRALSARRAS